MLSVLVPVYQVRDYLRACVDSILRQSVSLELLLVDDGSTDGSGAICDEYAARDARVRVIHQANGGLSAARVAGIRAARGEYLAFVDSDDWVDEDLFAQLLDPLQTNPQIDSAMGGYVMAAPWGRKTVMAFPPQAAVLTPIEAGHRMFTSQGFNWSLCGKVYRADLFKDAAFLQRWPHSFGEDTFINYYLLRKMRKIAYVPVQGYCYRTRATSMMHSVYHHGWMAYFTIYDELLADVVTWAPDLAKDIWDVAMKACLSVRQKLLQEGTCLEDAQLMQQYFLRWCQLQQGVWTPKLCWQWAYAGGISQAAYCARRKCWEQELKQFAQSATRFYLYGTGNYGGFFADWLMDLGITWHGALESCPEKKTFRDRPVLAPQDVAGQDAAVLIAMNERHTNEVLPILARSGIMKTLLGWRLLFGGRG